MLVVVSYDVNVQSDGGTKRLRKVAKLCENYGQRVQYSVFEIEVDPAQWAMLKAKLESIINTDTDSLRYYYLGKNWQHKVEHIGAKPVIDLNDMLLF